MSSKNRSHYGIYHIWERLTLKKNLKKKFLKLVLIFVRGILKVSENEELIQSHIRHS